jgi:hypothetical protein
MKAYAGNEGVTPLILQVGTRLEVTGQHHAAAISAPVKNPEAVK